MPSIQVDIIELEAIQSSQAKVIAAQAHSQEILKRVFDAHGHKEVPKESLSIEGNLIRWATA